MSSGPLGSGLASSAGLLESDEQEVRRPSNAITNAAERTSVLRRRIVVRESAAGDESPSRSLLSCVARLAVFMASFLIYNWNVFIVAATFYLKAQKS
jgi:hypothetical protein